MVEVQKPTGPGTCRPFSRPLSAIGSNVSRGCINRWPIEWPLRGAPQSLDKNSVDIWAVSLDLAPAATQSLNDFLSADERERARRFHFQRHRNRFIAGRGQLRSILSRYLDSRPEHLAFVYGTNGKPALEPRFNPDQLHFNLAHSDHVALIALSRLGPIGIDVERVRTLPDAQELVARFFSARESVSFAALPPSAKGEAFFNLWTRKEAWLKAIGEGIGHSLSLVEVSFLPGEPAALLSIAGHSQDAAQWRLETFNPRDNFVGALALPASDALIRYGRWTDPVSQR